MLQVQSWLQASNNTGILNTRSSKFRVGSVVRQTPEEGRRTYRPKCCRNNDKDKDDSLKTLNDKNTKKNLLKKNVLPTNPTKKKKKRFIIYYNKFNTSNLIFSNNSSSSTELLKRTNVIYMFKCFFRECDSSENNTHAGLTTLTLSRRLTMHLNDSRFIALHLETHSIHKSKF